MFDDSRRPRWAAALLGAIALAASPARALLIDFDDVDLEHGSVIDDEFLAAFGLTIGATNLGGGPDLAVVFDTTLRDTPDPDLEFDMSGPDAFFNVLIIQENDVGCLVDQICDEPDDEGDRPAGRLSLLFATPVTEFGFDLLDVEGSDEMGAVVFRSGGMEVARVSFESLEGTNGIAFGDRSANTVAPLVVSALNAAFDSADEVVIELGGSGAVDNLRFELVPEPQTAALLGLGLLGLCAPGRRRRARAP